MKLADIAGQELGQAAARTAAVAWNVTRPAGLVAVAVPYPLNSWAGAERCWQVAIVGEPS